MRRPQETLRTNRPTEPLPAPPPGAATQVPGFFVEYREELRRRAERGVGEDSAESLNAGRWVERAADLGFTASQPIAARQPPPAAALLRANYVRLQYERLPGDPEEESVSPG
jgi:hypothetical protein